MACAACFAWSYDASWPPDSSICRATVAPRPRHSPATPSAATIALSAASDDAQRCGPLATWPWIRVRTMSIGLASDADSAPVAMPAAALPKTPELSPVLPSSPRTVGYSPTRSPVTKYARTHVACRPGVHSSQRPPRRHTVRTACGSGSRSAMFCSCMRVFSISSGLKIVSVIWQPRPEASTS